ncbi:hypothetical protein P6U16_06635 [Rhizobium sp. 32-5/1]|uniref:hypothetical protein n=1 Tax=Rhizobium sp. 32-5/1 TaxID=3019602 RepID=UPI00240E29CA|nr:hypothetical protein [Rhizobium sp. 32-5/1]WEZ84318.1 hypothetical protein P6U16_06635 [Rhizobium sp. 32-5/1]
MAEDAKTSKKSKTVDQDAHWVQWLTGAICAVLVSGMIGWIGYEAVIGQEGQPELSTRIVHQDRVGDGQRVVFLIENAGARTAAAVVVQGQIRNGEAVLETSEVTFDYVPAHSSVSGAMLFQSPRDAGRLQIRPTGYSDP